ncbi:adenylate kinase isoenzyme 1-like [Paramacrobiotus metropolitanus]|uniref:adenylate kinase isoenzyme 1-like n=1 Tax=Paramacrobiotus metropolitanus TaxID=2943436 RepID=UPI00244581A1|nr:adenylate kinase isoenzyme 1-like [Paramacrobiotus metropolitanus]
MPADIAAIKKANLPIIFLMGGPGAGKHTQAAKIKAKYGYTHLSMGQLLRDEVKNNTERGKKVKEILDKGELVPSDVTFELLKEQMAKAVGINKPYLLHGFPRNKEQLAQLEKELGPAKAVIVLDVPEAKMTERLTARAKTGARADDKPEVVKKRIEVYNKDTKPLVDELINNKKAVKIAADGDVEKIFTEICKVLDTVK